ncbi:MAG: class I SAM-dependent methyltransferase [Bdellovibrionia bacterium]
MPKLKSRLRNLPGSPTLGTVSKYHLYERSVQSPKEHIDLVELMSNDLREEPARRLREDFCGTFLLSCEWIKRHPANQALGVDLDPEPVQYGRANHASKLTPSQKKRLRLTLADVRTPTSPKSDLIIVGNFSFFIFQERKTLLQYFRSCLKSLASQGLLILELAGGPGMITKTRERRTLTTRSGKKFLYFWDQKSFDPVTRRAKYAIHFKFPPPQGRVWNQAQNQANEMKNAFTYDWRLWTIPELRDILIDAGFKKTFVYWETSHKGEGTGEYTRSESGDNAFSWITYVVGQN